MDIKNIITPMLSGEGLLNRLAVIPEYNETIRDATVPERLMALSDLYSLYIPTDMSLEIYYKLYLALIRSLSQKNTPTARKQLYENHKAIKGLPYKGIMGGIDSFVITGSSGVGKSSAISRAIDTICPDNLIEIKTPSYQKIIPFLVIQTPFDCSLKSLLLEILRKTDELLDTKYYFNSLRVHATTDVLIGTVSTVCLNHIGVLVLDEIQNTVNSKNGKNLVGYITQLINNSGIAIVFVGTTNVIPFLEADFMLARRMMSLQYQPLPYDRKFYEVCATVWKYQYVKQSCELTDEIVAWLYNHSNGNISVVISLIHDAQELAVLSSTGSLNLEMLNIAYQKRLSLLHGFLSPQDKRYSVPRNSSAIFAVNNKELNEENEHLISDIVSMAKAANTSVIDLLNQYIVIEELRA